MFAWAATLFLLTPCCCGACVGGGVVGGSYIGGLYSDSRLLGEEYMDQVLVSQVRGARCSGGSIVTCSGMPGGGAY